MDGLKFSLAVPHDKRTITRLLTACQLPYEDIGVHIGNFILAKNDKELVGVVGLQVQGRVGLLRSLAVAPKFRHRGVGSALCGRILDFAVQQGVEEFYLLTTTADRFFARLGFAKVARKDLPQAIKNTEEFSSLCPETAVCMAKNITKRKGAIVG
ncbi:MAG: arsenic resistance N-acetyltransferase ArsN2 [bacterium]